MIENHAILVRGLSKSYGKPPNLVPAVAGIDFSVARGSTTALLGGNGAGKTTTIAMLLGLLKPSAGSVTVLGADMERQRHLVLPRMNFSSPYVDLPHRLTVGQNLRIFAQLYDVAEPAKRIADLAEVLDFSHLLQRPAGALSAGQKTRVALAKALINKPELLLLDEPTASLDPDTADWVRGLLERYRAERGATLLLASHNMAEVERLADQVLMMKQGRIVDRGTPAELLARYGRDDLEQVFLDIARGQGKAAEIHGSLV
ncbi:ABC transporter ATP-binding protein [Ferrovibrio sp.]|uniref:ABC transporter ATP-binding protein n=1 Tax=Ferrovibrio sp. TaxID=1917215 RepID=UPI001B799C5C|nr:ABC transporter ATP-binding protein [Ferrovibrio sp.]MBP7064077.1 ABC transporter ATP-binding protein [Ferrovibrio sp.]